MRYFWVIPILLCAISASAVDRITAIVTITNTAGTTNGQTFTVNGNVRTFTNVVYTPVSQVLTNSTHLGSKTNLFNAISSVPFNSVTLVNLGTNQFSLVGAAGTAMTVTPSAGYATITYSTQLVSSMTGVRVPIAGEPTGAAQTSIASLLSLGIWTYSTNAIEQSSITASNLVGITNAQTITGDKTFTGIASFTNAGSIRAGTIATTNLSVTSGTISLVTGLGTGTTNTWRLSGDVDSLDMDWSQLTGAGGSGYAFGSVFNADGRFTWQGSMVVTGAVVAGSIVLTNGPFTGDGSSLTNIDGASITGRVANATLIGRTVTNLTAAGTNLFPAGSDISFGRYSLSSLANGNNAGIVVGTNVFVEVSGPSASFAICGIAGGRDGKLIYIVNQTGFDMTISHQSGVDATSANRIITMTGADRATTGNGTATLIYSASASRWILISFDP